MGGAGCIYENTGFNVADERLHVKAAPVGVGSNRSGHGESIGASLFLCDSPRLAITVLQCKIAVNQFWPFDASFDLNHSALSIKMKYPAQASDVDQQRVSAKLLAAHGVPSPRNRDYCSIFTRFANNALHIFQGSWLENL